MGKIKNFIEEQKSDLKGLLFNYTFSLISAALLSVVACIEFELEKNIDAITNIEFFLAMFLVGALFIETYFVNKGEEKCAHQSNANACQCEHQHRCGCNHTVGNQAQLPIRDKIRNNQTQDL